MTSPPFDYSDTDIRDVNVLDARRKDRHKRPSDSGSATPSHPDSPRSSKQFLAEGSRGFSNLSPETKRLLDLSSTVLRDRGHTA